MNSGIKKIKAITANIASNGIEVHSSIKSANAVSNIPNEVRAIGRSLDSHLLDIICLFDIHLNILIPSQSFSESLIMQTFNKDIKMLKSCSKNLTDSYELYCVKVTRSTLSGGVVK